MSPFISPLRYPGGKRKLANFIKLIFRINDLCDGEYAEPYAGGASVALSLLFGEYVKCVHINDYDRGVYAFWNALLTNTDKLCEAISKLPLNMDEWHKQKQIQNATDPDLLELAVSTFFLNRTNRSGIISGGVIGGKQQTGKWKLDARFNKPELIRRIRKIAQYRSRIHLRNLDAKLFIANVVESLPQKSLTFFDPPYYVKGQQMLYTNYYSPGDHSEIAELISNLTTPWIVSYDNVDEIRNLYDDFKSLDYDLSYSAQVHYLGKEVIFFSDELEIPSVSEPAKVKSDDLYQLHLSMVN